MNNPSTLGSSAATGIEQLTENATDLADHALSATRRAANGALDRLQDGVDPLRQDSPGTLGRLGAQADALTRHGIERAQRASMDLRQRMERGSDRTVGHIREQPVTSVLIAAAAGGALAALIGLLARSHTHPR